MSTGEDMQTVSRMTIQYNETDWEYLKRVSSYTGQPIIPYSDKVFVGFFKNMIVQTPNLKYSKFGKKIKEERIYFRIVGAEVYPVATPIKLKTRNRETNEELENDYYVIESKLYNVGNKLECEYVLGKQLDYFVDPIPHEKIRGAVIEGRVIHIARTDESKSDHGRTEGNSDNLEGRAMGLKPLNVYIQKQENKGESRNEESKRKQVTTSDIAVMTLNLTEGLMKLGEEGQSCEDKYAGKSYFPYVTPYSQSNTGFTPAPESGDRVALYFPSENETHALVMGAVNNDGNGRFTNPDKRNFTLGNSQGGANNGKPMYDFTLNSEEFSISVGSVINMSSKGTVDISGTSNVDIASTGSSATLTANQNVDIRGNQNATVTASLGMAKMSAKTYATIISSQDAEISGGNNTNVGFSSGGVSNKTIVAGTKVDVKGGEVEIN